jgi:hypothetical protein
MLVCCKKISGLSTNEHNLLSTSMEIIRSVPMGLPIYAAVGTDLAWVVKFFDPGLG